MSGTAPGISAPSSLVPGADPCPACCAFSAALRTSSGFPALQLRMQQPRRPGHWHQLNWMALPVVLYLLCTSSSRSPICRKGPMSLRSGTFAASSQPYQEY
ncbi:hypothetical protein BV20DRAFT_967093 [Pilatotrama ljubarskyi]|nr:hypothetical protein BV20DRAFT_967093 [Pilatotrama ljubarskyi]